MPVYSISSIKTLDRSRIFTRTAILLGVLFLLAPFWSFAISLFLLFYRSWRLKEYKFLLFVISLFWGLLAYTQFTETGDLSRVYKRIQFSDTLSIQGYIAFMLSGSKYILFDWANLLIYKVSGNIRLVSFFWIFLLYYSFFMGILHLLEYKKIGLSWKNMGGIIAASVFCFILFTQVTEIMKQGVATAVFFYAYSCFLVGKRKRGIIIGLLSLGIHFSPLFLCPIFFAKSIGDKTLVLLMLLSFGFRGFNLMTSVANVLSSTGLFPVLGSLAEQYEENLDHFFSSSATFFTLTFWLFVLATCFVFWVVRPKDNTLVKAAMIMIIMLNLNYSVSHNFTRILNNMFPFYCTLFIELSGFKRNPALRKLALAAFITGTLTLNLRIAYERLAPDSSYPTQFMNNSIPQIMFSSAWAYWK